MHVIDILWRSTAKNQFVPGIASWDDSEDTPMFTPLVADSHLSWTVEGPRRCIGSRDSAGKEIRCPERRVVPPDVVRCGPCSAMDQLDPCIRCSGSNCGASDDRKNRCQNSQYAVYLAVFKDQTLKVGVSTLGRVKIRWLEQGADFAGVISTVHGGMSARRSEESIGRLNGITKQVRGERKASTFTQSLDLSTADNLAHSFLESNGILPSESSFALEDLSPYYGLSEIDTQPMPWRLSNASRSPQHLVGDVLGVKGSLLVTTTGSALAVTDVKQLIGYTVSSNPEAMMIAQAGLLDFL
jgi:hypothetical protein